MLHPPTGLSREAAFDVGNGCTAQGAIAESAGRKRRGRCTAVGSSRVFGPAADPLFCSAKKVGQKRRPLRRRSALRTDCTRRQELKREASETRFAQTADASLSVSAPGDASPSNGDPRQRQRQKQRQKQKQLSLRGQLQLSLRATSNIACRPARASQHETALAAEGHYAVGLSTTTAWHRRLV